MPVGFTSAAQVALPAQSGIAHAYQAVHLADAFSIRLPSSASGDPDVLARFIFLNQPSWIGKLMNVRDAIVVGLGLKTARQLAALAIDAQAGRVGIFNIYGTSDTEIVLGEDDKHLDFRVSVLCARGPGQESGRR